MQLERGHTVTENKNADQYNTNTLVIERKSELAWEDPS